ncbi:MAG: hypothetical protein IKZ29_10375 [Clostridiales bacterium]|nr:hypothetical protein [Clostridiales bacterium]
MAKGSRRRAKVIKAMIAFVIILALLTFFSNTIMNLTIPKVMGTYASRGNLSYSNSARGQITVDNQTEVKGLDGRTVEQVMVTNYDIVQKGDTICTLKTMEDSEELQSKRDQLQTLERTAELEGRKPSNQPDYSSYYDTINMCKETLSAAKDTLSKVRNKSSVESTNRAIIDEESVKVVSLKASVDAAAKTVEDLKKDIDAIDAAIAPLQSQIEVYKALGTPTPTPTPGPGDPVTTPDPSYVPNLDGDGLDKNSPTYEMDKLLFKINQYEEQKTALKSQLSSAQDRLDDASAALAECQGKIDEAQAEIDSLATLPTETAAQNAVTAAQNALNQAQKSLSDQQINDGITRDQAQDDIDKRNKDIEKLKKEIAEMEAMSLIKEIKAPASGYIYNISIAKDDVLTAKQVITYILPETDRACSVTFSFSAQAAQNIYIGMDLEVTSGFIEGCTVASMKPDPNDPRGTRLVKCIIEGNDAWPGEEITVNAGKGNDNYKCVVPASAVNQDNSNDFVYVIEGSSTPLGDKYTVKRVDVTIEATDGMVTAIKGEGLDKYDVMIVYRSEKPLEDGQRVRLEDYKAK